MLSTRPQRLVSPKLSTSIEVIPKELGVLSPTIRITTCSLSPCGLLVLLCVVIQHLPPSVILRYVPLRHANLADGPTSTLSVPPWVLHVRALSYGPHAITIAGTPCAELAGFANLAARAPAASGRRGTSGDVEGAFYFKEGVGEGEDTLFKCVCCEDLGEDAEVVC
ncbi:hypothetical protein SVAN01_12008 [Stagonosporopsis vannaccii]|nr:hypothetical protein SVAN01_12008 [Stagonosporopsis vannaccii]